MCLMKNLAKTTSNKLKSALSTTALLILLNFCFYNSAQAATYYIDCAGSNSNSGTSSASAWANTSPIQGKNFLKPGDTVEIKSGCVWTGPASHVIIDSAGTAANPIIIEPYGDGADPVFDGSVNPVAAVPNWSGWSVYNAANHVYVSNVNIPWVVNTIIVDGSSDLKGLNPSNQNATTLNSEPGSFFRPNAANNQIFIRMADNSNPNTHILKFGYYGNSSGHDRGLFSVMDDTTQYVTVRHMQVIGSNAQGFTSGAPYTRFENCLSEFSARESFYIIKNAVQNSTGATYNTLLNCTAEWANSNFGQNITIESSHVDLIDTTAEYGWMAGIDWLNYNSQTDASFGRCIRCISHDNSQRSYNHDPNGYDPQIYIDGGHDIKIIASTVYMSLSGFYNNQANGIYNISVQSEHPDIKPDYNIYVLNSLVYGSNYIEFQTGALYNSAPTTMQAVDNINLINNTFVRINGYQLLNWNNLDNTTSSQGVFLYNNIFYNPGGSTTGIAPALNLMHSDNNLYYNNSTGNQIYNSYNLAQWQEATGQDYHSLFANPKFVNSATGDYHLDNTLSDQSSTSPANGAADGVKLLGLSIFSDVGTTMTNDTDDPDDLDIGHHYNSLVNGIDSPDPSLPVVAITSPASGSTFIVGSNVTITAIASETNGTIKNISIYNGSGVLLGSSSTSPYNFIYSDILAGNYTFTAKATDANGVSETSSPITLTVASWPMENIINPANNSTLTAGSDMTITATASETNGTIVSVSFYNGTTLLGTSTNTSSPYSYTVTNVPAGAYSLTAHTEDARGMFGTSVPVNVTVTGGTTAPTITTQPASTTVAAPATATFTVVATGAPTPAYQWQTEASGAGSYTTISGATSASYTTPATTTANSGSKYKCVVTNSAGSVTSNVATLTVVGPPTVSITSPVSESRSIEGSNLNITASASETNGTIKQVAFYNGTTLLGTSTTSPYNFTWNNIPVGNYTLHAVAEDVIGKTATSNSVPIIITSWPSAYIISPSNGDQITAGSNLTITAAASENNGTISEVFFYNGTTLLGTSTTSPYTYNWTKVPAGTYLLTVKAEDYLGMFTQSGTVTATVQ